MGSRGDTRSMVLKILTAAEMAVVNAWIFGATFPREKAPIMTDMLIVRILDRVMSPATKSLLPSQKARA